MRGQYHFYTPSVGLFFIIKINKKVYDREKSGQAESAAIFVLSISVWGSIYFQTVNKLAN